MHLQKSEADSESFPSIRHFRVRVKLTELLVSGLSTEHYMSPYTAYLLGENYCERIHDDQLFIENLV